MLVLQVMAQRPGAHPEDDVVEAHPGGGLDALEPVDTPRLGGHPSGTADRHIEHRARRCERQRQLLLQQRGASQRPRRRAICRNGSRQLGQARPLRLSRCHGDAAADPRSPACRCCRGRSTTSAASAVARRHRRSTSGGTCCKGRTGRRSAPRRSGLPTAGGVGRADRRATARSARATRGPAPAWAVPNAARGSRCRRRPGRRRSMRRSGFRRTSRRGACGRWAESSDWRPVRHAVRGRTPARRLLAARKAAIRRRASGARATRSSERPSRADS